MTYVDRNDNWRDPRPAARQTLYHEIDETKTAACAVFELKSGYKQATEAQLNVLANTSNKSGVPAYIIQYFVSTHAGAIRWRYIVKEIFKGRARQGDELNEIEYVDFQRRLMGLPSFSQAEREQKIAMLGATSALDWDDDQNDISQWDDTKNPYFDYSHRHGTWGSNCPTIDFDGILSLGGAMVDSAWIEFDNYQPRVLIAIRKAGEPAPDKSKMAVIRAFASQLGIKARAVAYDPITWQFSVGNTVGGERDWVNWLYQLRGRAASEYILAGLCS